MKVTLISHASILVEAAGVTVLSDPWWSGPCFGAQWWTYPAPSLHALDGKHIDYIYLSHGHHDHFHPGTLATLPKTAKVLLSSSLHLSAAVRELGFETIEVGPDQAVPLGNQGLEVRIMPTYGDDTLMVLSDGREVCVNLNDALHAAPEPVQDTFIKRLRALYPKIDYVFCGYGVASHFPNCYRIPGKDAVATARQRQAYFNRQWARVIEGLRPHYGFPFAADVVFLQDDLFWANEATHNAERPTAAFQQQYPNSATKLIDIAPGFQIADGQVLSAVTRQPLQAARLREELSEQIKRANRVGSDNKSAISDVIHLLESNLSNCRGHLATFSGDYCVALRFFNSPTGLVLQKSGADLALHALSFEQIQKVDMSYTTRWAYLRWALQRPFGDEILFVGSGGIFEYASREGASRGIHQELISLIRNRPLPSRPLAAEHQSVVHKAKQIAKRLLGRNNRDLYNLPEWIVFN